MSHTGTQRLVAVFGSSQTPRDHAEWAAARRCGLLLAREGYGVATGGYGGTMEAVSAGAAEAGGHVVGVTAPSVFPDRTGANRHVVEEWPAPTLVDRIGWLVERTDASIALPGSIGTLTELVMAWNVAFVARFSSGRRRPVVAVGHAWKELVDAMTSRLDTDGSVVRCVPDVDTAVVEVASLLRR